MTQTVYRLEFNDGQGIYSRRRDFSEELSTLLNDAPTIHSTDEGRLFDLQCEHHFAWLSLQQVNDYFNRSLEYLFDLIVADNIPDLYIAMYEVPNEAFSLNTASQVVFIKEQALIVRKELVNHNTVRTILPNWLNFNQ